MGNFIKRTRRKTGKGQFTTFSTNMGTGKNTRSYSTKMGGRTVTNTYSSDGKSKRTEYIKCGTTGAVKKTVTSYNPKKVKKFKGSSGTRRRRKSSSAQGGCAVLIFAPVMVLIIMAIFANSYMV